MTRDPFEEARPQLERARELTENLPELERRLTQAKQTSLAAPKQAENIPLIIEQTESELRGARRDAQICLAALGRCGRVLHEDARNLSVNLDQIQQTLRSVQVESARRGLEQSILRTRMELEERNDQLRQLESIAYALGQVAGVSVGTTAFANAERWRVPGAGNRSSGTLVTAHYTAAGAVHGNSEGGLRGLTPDPEIVRDAVEAARGRPLLREVPAAADTDAFGGRRSTGHRPDRWTLGSQKNYARAQNIIEAGVEAWWKD